MSNVVTFPNAKLPTKRELRARTNLPYQLWRFVILNFKMIKMITKGHH
ncbi:MAG: hypothetical protein RIR66_172 [Actinomycetota bacterium]|jgi:hypothetical protein